MIQVQDLIEVEEDAMTMVGHLVWSIEDTCNDTIMVELVRPLDGDEVRQSATFSTRDHAGDTNPQDNDKQMEPQSADINEILKTYYHQAKVQVTEFTETILYSILFYKWAEANDGNVPTSPTKWKQRLPDKLRRLTRAKASRIVASLFEITRLRLEAIDHIYLALRRAEQLTYEYIQRKGDRILHPDAGDERQRAELTRLENDALNYATRQMTTQLKLYQPAANDELYITVTDLINTSLENLDYCKRLHRWASDSVRFSKNNHLNPEPPNEIVDSSTTGSTNQAPVTSIVLFEEQQHEYDGDRVSVSCDSSRPVSVIYVHDQHTSTLFSI